MITVGFDPGLKGGIAILHKDEPVHITDMPVLKLDDNKHMINATAIYNLLSTFRTGVVNIAALEVVHAMPKQGVTSMFTFGYGYGLVRGAIDCSGYFCESVRPQAWKKHFGLIGQDKDDGLLVVEQLWPHVSNSAFITQRGRVIDGRVDAALIARYCYDTRRDTNE